MAGLADLRRAPSALDMATAVHTPGGAVTYLYQSETVAAQERETARQLAAFHAEQAVEREKESVTADRVKQFVAAGPGGDPAPSARAALIGHLAWLERTRRQAVVAASKARETASANSRHHAAVTELSVIEGEIRLEHAEWAKFTCDRPPPDGRIAELKAQEQIIRETASMAQIADQVAVEARIAQGCVNALERVLALRQREVLREIEGQPLAATIRKATAVIEATLGEMAALDQVAQMDWDVSHTLTTLGIKAPPPFMLARTKVTIPGQQPFEITVDATALELFKDAMVKLAQDPEADISPSPTPPDGQPPSGPKSLLNSAMSLIRKPPCT